MVLTANEASGFRDYGGLSRTAGGMDFFADWDLEEEQQEVEEVVTFLANGTLPALLSYPSTSAVRSRADQAIFRGDVPLDMIWDGQGLSKYRDKESANPLADVTESLWRRASSAGAKMALQRKAFGIADDIYAAGLLVAYLAFIPFCEVGSIDGPALQKLLERTFRLDIAAARDYCAADDRWKDAVEFLDLGQGAGWNLLQAMLNPDYRQRPTAEAVMKHPFLTGEVLV
ncbi:hypothetical protein CBR_g8898 [Chara braunii]|uniref:Protein kinase domain-containing protein n=1 Tax=Chara braunii TaxID=69332 RepID=A0A388KN46_CHABU|nr:hypothetical protein CBR_g8898 [Chara braunii]|eukprot:GBG71482.1 hypothetical protein CBR_g8898 [Chara braunii]